MTYIGKVENGVVVLPHGISLPEGSEVKVEPLELSPDMDPFLKAIQSLAKPRPDWPDDFALNHGYYLYGEPKREP